MTVTVNGVSLDLEPGVEVTAGAVSAGTSTAIFAASPIAAGMTSVLTLVAKDASGNPINGLASKAFAFHLSGGKSSGKFGTVTPTGNPGTYSVTFSGVVAGTISLLTVTIAGVKLDAGPTIQVTPGAVSAAASTFSFAAATLKTGSTEAVKAVVKDAEGNAVSALAGSAFVFELGDGTSGGTFGTVTETSTPGTYQVSFTGTTAGSVRTVSLLISGVMLTEKSKVTVVA